MAKSHLLVLGRARPLRVSFRLMALMVVVVDALGFAAAKCPTPDEIPVAYPNGSYVCAYAYIRGKSHDIPELSCRGEYAAHYFHGRVYQSDCFRRHSATALVVKAGCKMTTYDNWCAKTKKTTAKNVYQGPGVWPRFPPRGRRRPNYLSCTCKMAPITCEPSDRWESVRICDATRAGQEMECSFKQYVGTTFASSLTAQMELDHSIYDHIQHEFYAIMAGMNVSEKTGYDWRKVPDHVRWPKHSVETVVKVPRGHLLEVKQVVGYCGKHTHVRTQSFKFVENGTSSADRNMQRNGNHAAVYGSRDPSTIIINTAG